MLNKPFILTLLFIAISIGLSIVLGIIFALLGMKGNSGMSVAIAMGSALYVGQIYVNKNKVELPRMHKIKIALYYLIIQTLFSFCIVALLQSSKLVAPVILFTLFLNGLTALVIYPALGRGCRMKLKQLEKNGSLNIAQEPQI